MPSDPSFENASAWSVSGGAVVTEVPGQLDLTSATPCSGAGATTTYDLGSYADVGPIRLNVNWHQFTDYGNDMYGAGLAIRFGDGYTFPEQSYGDVDVLSTLCLGELAYGDSSTLFVGLGSPPQDGCGTVDFHTPTLVTDATMVFDDSCPTLGSVTNGDFEAGGVGIPGWEESDTGVTLRTDGDVEMRLNFSGYGNALGTMSVPDVAGQALSFEAEGTLGSAMSMMITEENTYGFSNRWEGTGSAESLDVCIPEWMWGTAPTFHIFVFNTYGDGTTGVFDVDDFDVVQNADCIPGGSGLINGDFENDDTGWWLEAGVMESPYDLPLVMVQGEPANDFLRAQFYTPCSNAMISQSVVVPDGANAFRFKYRNSNLEVHLALGINYNATTLTDASSWTSEWTCIGDAMAGHPISFRFDMTGGPGECSVVLEDFTFDLDDVGFINEASCSD